MNQQEFDKEFGKYFLDISKLIFGGAVLATILKVEDLNRMWILVLGGIATLGFSAFGFYYLKNKK